MIAGLYRASTRCCGSARGRPGSRDLGRAQHLLVRRTFGRSLPEVHCLHDSRWPAFLAETVYGKPAFFLCISEYLCTPSLQNPNITVAGASKIGSYLAYLETSRGPRRAPGRSMWRAWAASWSMSLRGLSEGACPRAYPRSGPCPPSAGCPVRWPGSPACRRGLCVSGRRWAAELATVRALGRRRLRAVLGRSRVDAQDVVLRSPALEALAAHAAELHLASGVPPHVDRVKLTPSASSSAGAGAREVIRLSVSDPPPALGASLVGAFSRRRCQKTPPAGTRVPGCRYVVLRAY